MYQTIEDLQYINSLLDEAAEYGLMSEVVFTALQSMKENTSLTIQEAIQIGYNEWVK